MDIRLYCLLLIFAVVGTNADLNWASERRRRDLERNVDSYDLRDLFLVKLTKRAADTKEIYVKTTSESSEDMTTSLTTKSPGTKSTGTKSPGTTSPSTKNPGTTSPSTTSPSTKSPSTTKGFSSKPKPASTTSTAISTKPTTKSVPTSTEATTKPTTEATSKPELGSRSAFDAKEDSPSKPTDTDEKAEKKPSTLSPRLNADTPDNKDKSPSSPSTGTNPNVPRFNSGYPQVGSYPFPGFNSIPPYGPNYAITSTNQGPGMASASASSFASSSNNPPNPSFNSRGGFPSYYPYYNPNEYSPNQWPTNDASQNNPLKPMTSSRSYFDTDEKPNNPTTGNDPKTFNNPNSIPSSRPQNFPSRSYGGPYTPNFNYPPVNSAQGPNYAWTNSGPGYAGASAGASSGSGLPAFGSRGAFPDNSAGNAFPDNSGYTPDVVASGFQPGFGSGFGPGFGNIDDGFSFHQRMMENHFRRIQEQIEAQQRALFDANNRLGGFGSGPGSSEPGVHSAISSISLGPGGGYQTGQISPVAPGIESRFADALPPASGGSVGVFSSSRSSSATDGTGRTISHKSATTGVNDNGKITFRTVED